MSTEGMLSHLTTTHLCRIFASAYVWKRESSRGCSRILDTLSCSFACKLAELCVYQTMTYAVISTP